MKWGWRRRASFLQDPAPSISAYKSDHYNYIFEEKYIRPRGSTYPSPCKSEEQNRMVVIDLIGEIALYFYFALCSFNKSHYQESKIHFTPCFGLLPPVDIVTLPDHKYSTSFSRASLKTKKCKGENSSLQTPLPNFFTSFALSMWFPVSRLTNIYNISLSLAQWSLHARAFAFPHQLHNRITTGTDLGTYTPGTLSRSLSIASRQPCWPWRVASRKVLLGSSRWVQRLLDRCATSWVQPS